MNTVNIMIPKDYCTHSKNTVKINSNPIITSVQWGKIAGDINNQQDLIDYIKENQNDVDMSDYALKSELPTNVSELNNDAAYITIDELPTVDLNDYVKIEDVPLNVSELQNDAGYITLNDVPETDLSDYVKKTDIPTVPTNVSEFTNDAGYLTEHQSLDGYAKVEDIPTVPTNVSSFTNDSGYITLNDVPETDLSAYYNKTEINNKLGDINTLLDNINGEVV